MKLLSKMANAMKYEDWYATDLHGDQGWGLGRVGLGPVESCSYPVWNEERSICLVMEGELYGTENARRRLIDSGHQLQTNDAGELLLRQYLESGDHFVDDCNGAYTVAVYDLPRRRLLLATDHLGQRPLYYTEYGGDFFFAGSVAALLANPSCSRQLDGTAVAQLLGFEHVLGDRTLLAAAKLMPPGTVMVRQDGRSTTRQYWTVSFPETFEARSDKDYLDELGALFHRAVARHGNEGRPAIQMLSGGLDSRQMLGGLAEIQPPDRPGRLQTLTFGQKVCSDRQPAAEIARIAGTAHRFYELTPTIIPAVAEAAVQRLDGLEGIVHALAMAPWLDVPESPQLVYKGFFGDKIWTSRQYSSQYSDDSFQAMLWQRTLVLFSEAEQDGLLNPSFRLSMEERLRESFHTIIALYQEPTIADRFSHFIISERQRRFIQYGVEGVRTQHLVRTPFTDREYVEFALRVPTHLRVERQIQVDLVAHLYPKLAKVPWELTGLPMMSCFRDSRIRMSNSLRWILRNQGLSWVPVWERKPMADFDGWMRHELRSWVEETLLHPSALSRGIFEPNAVRQIVTDHMAGADLSRKLGMLMTIELWCRSFLG